MIEEKTICICGGGGLGSVIAGIAASGGYRVNILTRRPEKWGDEMTVIDPAGKIFVGKLNKVSDKAGDVIPESDIIFFCLPGTAFYDEFIKIKPYVTDSAVCFRLQAFLSPALMCLVKAQGCLDFSGFLTFRA